MIKRLLRPKCLPIRCLEITLGTWLILVDDELIVQTHLLRSIREIRDHGLPSSGLGRIVLVRRQEIVQILLLLAIHLVACLQVDYIQFAPPGRVLAVSVHHLVLILAAGVVVVEAASRCLVLQLLLAWTQRGVLLDGLHVGGTDVAAGLQDWHDCLQSAQLIIC